MNLPQATGVDLESIFSEAIFAFAESRSAEAMRASPGTDITEPTNRRYGYFS